MGVPQPPRGGGTTALLKTIRLGSPRSDSTRLASIRRAGDGLEGSGGALKALDGAAWCHATNKAVAVSTAPAAAALHDGLVERSGVKRIDVGFMICTSRCDRLGLGGARAVGAAITLFTRYVADLRFAIR